MIVNVVYVACAAAVWGVVLRKGVLAFRHPRDPAVWALVASAVFAALAFSLAPDRNRLFIDTTTGVANLSGLLIYSCAVAYAGASRVRLLYWTASADQPRANPRIWTMICLAALAAMAALFAVAAVPVEATDFEVRYAAHPAVAGFVLIYVTAVVVAFGGNARLYWRYAAAPVAPWVRRGLRLNAVGSGCLVGYGLTKLVRVVLRWLGFQRPPGDDVASLVLALGALLLVAGITMPAWGPRLAAGPRWVARYRTYRALYSLWLAVYQYLPHLVLLTPVRPRSWAALRDLNGLLYYRPAVEIRDAYRELRPHMDRRVAHVARAVGQQQGLTEDSLHAAAEAAVVSAALRDYACGVTPPPGCAVDPGEISVGDDAVADRLWLARVSRAFAGSTVVGKALRQAPQAETPWTSAPGGR